MNALSALTVLDKKGGIGIVIRVNGEVAAVILHGSFFFSIMNWEAGCRT